jgi:anti-sigma factor RsiW
MKQCWPDGDLRAFLDDELPRESQEQVGAHLELCGACSDRYRELSQRAARVSSLMAMLPAAAPAVGNILPPRVRHGRQWAVAALSMAAALAVGFVVLPKHGVVQPLPIAKALVPVTTVPVAPALTALPRPAVRHRAARRPVIREDFLRLDDEPFETGTVVRISAENGDVQADLIVGPDGRAHAIRVVSNQ